MNDSREPLLQRMREQAHALLRKADQREIQNLNRLVDATRDELARLEQYSEAELEQAALALRKELREKTAHWAEEWQEIRQWAEFDLELVEARVLEKLLAIADPTRVELAQWLRPGSEPADGSESE